MRYYIELGRPSDHQEAVAIDDDASNLFESVGITVSGSKYDEFSRAEQARWLRAAELDRMFFGCDETGMRLGLVVLARIDGGSYIEQLSVKQRGMRRGLGRFLLEHAIEWARQNGDPAIWLTTYGHLGWNRPFYETAGFQTVDERVCGSELRQHLAEERRVLPFPEQRVPMQKLLTSRESA